MKISHALVFFSALLGTTAAPAVGAGTTPTRPPSMASTDIHINNAPGSSIDYLRAEAEDIRDAIANVEPRYRGHRGRATSGRAARARVSPASARFAAIGDSRG